MQRYFELLILTKREWVKWLEIVRVLNVLMKQYKVCDQQDL